MDYIWGFFSVKQRERPLFENILTFLGWAGNLDDFWQKRTAEILAAKHAREKGRK